MSKFYIGVQKDEPITEIAWLNKNEEEESIDIVKGGKTTYISINDSDGNSSSLHKEDIPKLEAALAKARELGWFE